MPKNKTLKQTPVLKVEDNDMQNGRESQSSTSQNGINQYYDENVRLQDEENN